MFRRNCRKVVERLVYTGRQTCSRHVVAQYSLIHDLREETRLWSKLVKQIRDIFLAFDGECLLIASSSAKGNDDDFPFFCRCLSVYKRAATHQGRSERESCGIAQKLAPAATKV